MTNANNPRHLPKLCGADIELGNFILGRASGQGTGAQASRLLLRQVPGLPQRAAVRVSSAAGSGDQAQDWGRRFLPQNSSSVYVDLDHIEVCIPEVISAFDHVAAWHAMLRILRLAWRRADLALPEGERIKVLVNNSDGRSHSYGGHLSVLVTRRAYDNLFHRKLQYLLFLASAQVSSIVFSGSGKVGAENGAPAVPFQLSQRADFFETLCGPQTTHNRPIVNARNESLCGIPGTVTDRRMARVHCIFFDAGLCHVASLLRIGFLQIVLAMIEADRVEAKLLLEDPLAALRAWSHDPGLRARARLLSGERLSAVEHQLLLHEEAQRFVAAGHCDGIVPRAGEIVELWGETLELLRARDFEALAARLDWVLKLRTLEQALQSRAGLEWQSPAVRHLDQIYGSIDPDEGLYWTYEKAGAVRKVVTEEEIDQFVRHPPEDTRAWTRAWLLQVAGSEWIHSVDWDMVQIRVPGAFGPETRIRIDLNDPLRFNRADLEALCPPPRSLADVIEALAPHATLCSTAAAVPHFSS